MKNIYFLFVFFLLFSCSSNDGQNQYKLLRSIVDVSDNGSSTTTLFTYVGNKIERIDEADKSTVFIYTDNLITQATILDKKTQTQNTLKYSYEDGQLVQIVSSENYIITYTYNSDETVSYEKTQKDSGNNVVSDLHGVLYFQNDNLLKNEWTYTNQDLNAQITESEEFQYDSKINPMHNVMGFGKLLDYSKHISPNNSKYYFSTYDVTFLGKDQAMASASLYPITYKYDSDGYPTEVDSDRTFLGDEDSNNNKTYFNYK